MTEFHPILPPSGAGGVDPSKEPKKAGRGHPPDGPSFAEVLQGASPGSKAGAAGRAAGAESTPPPSAPYLGEIGQGPAAREAVIAASDRFFQLLEAYQAQLGDAATSLKDIAPLMHEIEQFRDRMVESIASLPPGDPGRNILEEMAVLASSEAARFHRGDYI